MTGVLPGLEAHAGRDLALGQWDTHPELARAFVRWCGVHAQSVLEPSCGIGNIAKEAMAVGGAKWVCGVEIDPARAGLARERRIHNFEVHTADIFTWPEADFDVAIGNPQFEQNGALRHAKRWLDFAPRACFIAPLETLAGERDGLWEEVRLRRVGVCAPGRPPFGLGGNGMSEIAFFEVCLGSHLAHPLASIARVNWRELGKP